jgi:hypothetical protein
MVCRCRCVRERERQRETEIKTKTETKTKKDLRAPKMDALRPWMDPKRLFFPSVRVIVR